MISAYRMQSDWSNELFGLKIGSDKITVNEDGTVLVNGKEEAIVDYLYDPDVDLHDCILPHIKLGTLRNKNVYIDELMVVAGYVQGDDAILNRPVVLHKDYDSYNFSSTNLEWVEETDQRYQEYKEKTSEVRHQKRIKLNPGRTLPLGW